MEDMGKEKRGGLREKEEVSLSYSRKRFFLLCLQSDATHHISTKHFLGYEAG